MLNFKNLVKLGMPLSCDKLAKSNGFNILANSSNAIHVTYSKDASDMIYDREPTTFLSSVTKVLFCVAGIYICYLTWGVLQERISTIAYPKGIEPLFISISSYFPFNYFTLSYNLFFRKLHSFTLLFASDMEPNDKFSSFVFLNCCQALASWVVSFSVLYYYKRSSKSLKKNIESKSISQIFSTIPDPPVAPKESKKFPALDKRLFWLYLKISIIYSISSPFAYASLKYIHYVAMNLGKACKLLPLVLIKIFVKRESIEKGKLFNLLLITAGVVGFLLFEAPKASKQPSSIIAELRYQYLLFRPSPFTVSVFGIFLLLVNLFLDGLMNSMQDEVFSEYKLSPFHMMFNLNRNSSILMLSYLLFYPFSTELKTALGFLALRPSILPDILLFSICGAVGQAIVFLTLGNFGAIFLVTITVTRKLFTILLSVLYFGHSLTIYQWFSVAFVFLALIMEAIMSASKRKKLSSPVELSPPVLKKNEVNLPIQLKQDQ